MTWLYVPNLTSSTSSASAPEAEALTSASSWQSQALAQSVWWRGKPSPSLTWSKRCAKVSWLRRLSGQMPEPSAADHGAALWMASLAAFRVSRTATPADASAPPTSATSGPRPAASSSRRAHGLSSSRTSPACSRLSPAKLRVQSVSGETYSAWVLRLREACSRRRRLAAQTNVSAFSSLAWRTPGACDAERGTNGTWEPKPQAGQHSLRHQTSRWDPERAFPLGSARPTPAVVDAERDGLALRQMTLDAGDRGFRKGISLHHEVANWPTPAARDYRTPNSQDSQDRRNEGSSRGQQLPNFVEHIWSTPAVADVTGGRMARSGDRSGELLLNGQTAFLSGHLDLDLWPAAQPAVRGMAHGVAGRVDPLRLLGNGVKPLQAAYALRTLATDLARRSAGAAELVRLMSEP